MAPRPVAAKYFRVNNAAPSLPERRPKWPPDDATPRRERDIAPEEAAHENLVQVGTFQRHRDHLRKRGDASAPLKTLATGRRCYDKALAQDRLAEQVLEAQGPISRYGPRRQLSAW